MKLQQWTVSCNVRNLQPESNTIVGNGRCSVSRDNNIGIYRIYILLSKLIAKGGENAGLLLDVRKCLFLPLDY